MKNEPNEATASLILIVGINERTHDGRPNIENFDGSWIDSGHLRNRDRISERQSHALQFGAR